MKDLRQKSVAPLLFCSGLCALIYQTAWLREFRLIFGASTAASAAVLGIFMGGLGLGSAWLGRRSELAKRPLVLYGNLELLIALSAAATPALVWLVRQAYAATGGTMVLGDVLGTVVCLLLSALVLIVPTFLMGGTLPAAARSVETDDDLGRRSLALLYGCNTLGAVTGAALSTFWLIEVLGNRGTLWAACALNIVVALIARRIGRGMAETQPSSPRTDGEASAPATSPRFVMIAAASVGFAFMLMELVWYRMLSPILGGSTFTFGLILVVALLGVGLGGAFYALAASNRRPTVNGFALTCALEAVFIAAPYALGDRLALLALVLRPLGGMGFAGQVLGWAIITMIVVLPAALVAGYQFPMLIALLGEGREDVGRHTGFAYAANTAGAIAGSLIGGFGLLPLLTAPGVWKAVVALLAMLALGAMFAALRRQERFAMPALGAAVAAVLMLFATGPTAAWRHSGIGAGRAEMSSPTVNALEDFQRFFRRSVFWEAEGVESSVAMSSDSGVAFIINGKIDGNSRLDSGTQVMSGLVGAILHPQPKRSLVIGLGTGSTAGWLGQVPEMERVDVIELEPAVREVARVCAPVNCSVLENPKVHLHIGDAREVLLTTPAKYDIIFSEPSNPYRAGIASLFTREFYEAVTQRLENGGIFLQWLQAYDIDGEAIRSVYATLGSVFPNVETWTTQANDLLLVATREPLSMDAARLRQRVAGEPFHSALRNAWRVDSLEGFLSHYVGHDALTRAVAAAGNDISTDDRNQLEFGFARSVGSGRTGMLAEQVKGFARASGWHRPAQLTGEIDWASVEAQEPTVLGVQGIAAEATPGESEVRRAHREFLALTIQGQPAQALAHWRRSALGEPATLLESQILAALLANAGDEDSAQKEIAKVAEFRPSDAHAIRARLFATQQNWADAAAELSTAFAVWRTDPWATPGLVNDTIDLAQRVVRESGQREIAQRLFADLRGSFAVGLARERRMAALIDIGKATESTPFNALTRHALDDYGPQFPWRKPFLDLALHTWNALGDPRLESAALDLQRFSDHEPIRFDAGLPKPERVNDGANPRHASNR
jgi:spermidine synthase